MRNALFVSDGGFSHRRTDPANPTLRGGYVTPGFAFGVSVVGRLIYVADQEDGLLILRLH